MQEIIVVVLFVLALTYMGRMIWKQFAAKSAAGCAKGCGSCSAIDIKKIEAALNEKTSTLSK